MRITSCCYDEPWLESSGDQVRINNILNLFSNVGSVTAFCLCNSTNNITNNNIVYTICPPMLYNKLHFIIPNKSIRDVIKKLLQMIFDEPVMVKKALNSYPDLIIAHGSMSVAPFILRLLGYKNTIIYDTLANYMQTLLTKKKYTKNIRDKLILDIKIKVYSLVHSLQLRSADFILYPSLNDASSAISFFNIDPLKVHILPNPFPITYKNYEEYIEAREHYRYKLGFSKDKIIVVFTAGSRSGNSNKEALELVINLSKEDRFKDISFVITGPWEDYKKYTNNNVKFTGIIDTIELKKLLAASDIGLAPIFFGSGTFLKVLGYLAAGLNIVGTKLAIENIDKEVLEATSSKFFEACNYDEFVDQLEYTIHNLPNVRKIITEEFSKMYILNFFNALLKKLGCVETDLEDIPKNKNL